MSKLFVGLVPATILIACSAIGWKAQAAMVTGVENRLLTNSQPLVEKVRRRGYEYDHHYGFRPYGHYGYRYRPYGYDCTFAIREYQRRWPYQLWPPSMRCFPYPQ
jgi:hypothetical protein